MLNPDLSKIIPSVATSNPSVRQHCSASATAQLAVGSDWERMSCQLTWRETMLRSDQTWCLKRCSQRGRDRNLVQLTFGHHVQAPPWHRDNQRTVSPSPMPRMRATCPLHCACDTYETRVILETDFSERWMQTSPLGSGDRHPCGKPITEPDHWYRRPVPVFRPGAGSGTGALRCGASATSFVSHGDPATRRPPDNKGLMSKLKDPCLSQDLAERRGFGLTRYNLARNCSFERRGFRA